MGGKRYRITVRGRLGPRYASALDGMALEPGNGQSCFVGDVDDQARLYGMLNRIRDLGLELTKVEELHSP